MDLGPEELAQVAGDQAVEDQAVEDQVAGEQVAGVQAMEFRAAQGQAAHCGPADRVAVYQRLACGPELAAAAARHLFLEWWPALRAEPLAGAASPQKKSSSGFSAR